MGRISGRDYPARARISVSWQQLADHPLVTVQPGYGVRRSIDQAAAAAGVQLQFAHAVSLLGTRWR
ncbi:LysR substrate-binding domain-containing protein [Variovorax sp. LjRoot290]|uniref:LysR substrate-binding domain-containing protein n=1 Tax=Variovorax sp. LjRoot290 TaxID=3342316 RepID=UPI003ECFE93C